MFLPLTPKEVIDTYWNRGMLPIDPFKIATRAGIEINELPDGSRYSGELTVRGDSATIFYNASEGELRKRFTVAHELGHYFLRHGHSFLDAADNFDLYTLSPREMLANSYASKLLMPAEYVRAVFWRRGITTLEGLCDYFDVSEIAMVNRLKQLRILDK